MHLAGLGTTIVEYSDLSQLNRADVDALFLPAPDRALQAAEMDAIETFYRSGGSVLLLDDWGNAPDQWNAASNQVLQMLGLDDGGNPSGGTPLDAAVIGSHPVTDGPAGSVTIIGLNGDGYDFFVNLPSFAVPLAVDGSGRPVAVAVPRARSTPERGRPLSSGMRNLFEEFGEGTRTWMDNLALWDNAWAWLLGCTRNGTIDSPVHSGRILAGDTLRFAAHGVPGQFHWDFGDGRTSVAGRSGTDHLPDGGPAECRAGRHRRPGSTQSDTRYPDRHGGRGPRHGAGPRRGLAGRAAGLAISQPAQIGYTVRNAGNAALSGASWRDALYLSRDAYLDVGDTLLASVAVTRNLAAGAEYQGTFGVTIPAVAEGAYYLLLSVDDGWEVLEKHQLNNELAVATDSACRCCRTECRGRRPSPKSNTSHYYRVDVPPGKNLTLTLDDADNAGVNELYARFGTLAHARPSTTIARSRLSGADQQILIPAATVGTWYVLAYGDVGARLTGRTRSRPI